jgi:hypothetical protein
LMKYTPLWFEVFSSCECPVINRCTPSYFALFSKAYSSAQGMI